jgi:hypothetical protein
MAKTPKVPEEAPDPVRVRCPHCQSRLDVIDTASGGRTVSVFLLGPTVEVNASALELFIGPGSGLELHCPACNGSFDPSMPHTIPPLRRA